MYFKGRAPTTKPVHSPPPPRKITPAAVLEVLTRVTDKRALQGIFDSFTWQAIAEAIAELVDAGTVETTPFGWRAVAASTARTPRDPRR